MELRVNVTREHIRKGWPGHGFLCPVARAIEDAFIDQHPEIRIIDINVITTEVEIEIEDNVSMYFMLPAEITQFIQDYDHGRPVEPVTFVLSGPYKVTSDEDDD